MSFLLWINLNPILPRHIIGLRNEMGWLKGGAALIIIGGWDAKDPVLERCKLEDPRGWSCLHLVDGSQGGRVIGNGTLRAIFRRFDAH